MLLRGICFVWYSPGDQGSQNDHCGSHRKQWRQWTQGALELIKIASGVDIKEKEGQKDIEEINKGVFYFFLL